MVRTLIALVLFAASAVSLANAFEFGSRVTADSSDPTQKPRPPVRLSKPLEAGPVAARKERLAAPLRTFGSRERGTP